jgi:histidinol-phosphate/aromatic aminotransferase/cobyric acid decarboxylase-like protein
MMMEVEGEVIPGAFGKHMLDHGIGVRDLRGLPGCGAGLYRIGIRSKSDNDRFLEATRSWTSWPRGFQSMQTEHWPTAKGPR